MRLAALAWSLAACSSVAAHAQTAKVEVERIEIVQTGIYRLSTVKRQSAPGSPTGDLIAEGSAAEFVSKTTTIPARVKIQFGYDFRPIGAPNGAQVEFTAIIRHPKQGVRNPKTGKAIFQSEYTAKGTIGEITTNGYAFEEEWELVPGTWTFELWYRGRKLSEEVFTVVK